MSFLTFEVMYLKRNNLPSLGTQPPTTRLVGTCSFVRREVFFLPEILFLPPIILYSFFYAFRQRSALEPTIFDFTQKDKSQIGGRNYQFLLREPPIVSGAAGIAKQRKVSGSNSENEASRLEGKVS
jgi:hypothetical protein